MKSQFKELDTVRHKTAKRKTPETRQSEKNTDKEEITSHTKQKMISTMESPSFKTEIISTTHSRV